MKRFCLAFQQLFLLNNIIITLNLGAGNCNISNLASTRSTPCASERSKKDDLLHQHDHYPLQGHHLPKDEVERPNEKEEKKQSESCGKQSTSQPHLLRGHQESRISRSVNVYFLLLVCVVLFTFSAAEYSRITSQWISDATSSSIFFRQISLQEK